jgi:hypothetical protein
MGDVNSDGKVDAADVITLNRYISGKYNISADSYAADVNSDGFVDATDLDILRRMLVGTY